MSAEEFNKYKTRSSGSQLAGFLLEHGGSVQIIPPTEMLSMNGIKLKARLKVKGVAGTFEKGDKSIVFTVMAGKGGGKADQPWVKQALRSQLGVSALDVVDAPNAAIDPDPSALKPPVGSTSAPPPTTVDLGDLDDLSGLDSLDELDVLPPQSTEGPTDPSPSREEVLGLDELDLLDTTDDLTPALPEGWDAALKGYRDALDRAEEQIAALKQALRKTGDEDLTQIADIGLNGLFGEHRAPLDDALRELEQADPDQRPPLLARVARSAAAFDGHLRSGAAVKAVDANPFGVSVALKDALAPAVGLLATTATA